LSSIFYYRRHTKKRGKRERERERKEIENFAFLNYFFFGICANDKTRGTHAGN